MTKFITVTSEGTQNYTARQSRFNNPRYFCYVTDSHSKKTGAGVIPRTTFMTGSPKRLVRAP